MANNTQYTQGSLVTITVTTQNTSGLATPPDNNAAPTYTLDYVTPTTPFRVVNGQAMLPLTSSWFYTDIDSRTLGVGEYLFNATFNINGSTQQVQQRFDVIAGDGMSVLPLDPISQLRLRLRDNSPDPTRWVWTDNELQQYLNDALNEFNAAPRKTNFFWLNIPIQFVTNVLKAAEVSALEAAAIKVAHKPISYNDKGTTVNFLQQQSNYMNIARMLREHVDPERLRIKRNLAPRFGYIGGSQMPYMSYPPIRATDRQWF